MALLVTSLLALLATAAHAQFNTSDIILGHNKSLEYDWATAIPTGWAPSILPDPLYSSPDACDNGNSGLAGLSFDRCVAACSSLSTCVIVAYYPDWNNGTSACFAYGTKDTKVLNLIKDVADSATPVAIRDSANKATVYYGIKQEGYGPNNWQNFRWATDTNDAKFDFFRLGNKLFTSSDKGVCDGDPDDGITGVGLRECIDLCLSIPNCLLVKFIPDGGSVQATTGRCYAHDAVPDGVDKDKTGLSDNLTTYDELNDPVYVGISFQYFVNKIGKP